MHHEGTVRVSPHVVNLPSRACGADVWEMCDGENTIDIDVVAGDLPSVVDVFRIPQMPVAAVHHDVVQQQRGAVLPPLL